MVVFGKIVNLLLQIFYTIWQFFIVPNGQILNKWSSHLVTLHGPSLSHSVVRSLKTWIMCRWNWSRVRVMSSHWKTAEKSVALTKWLWIIFLLLLWAYYNDLRMHSAHTWPYAIPNGPLDLYSLAIKTKIDTYDDKVGRVFLPQIMQLLTDWDYVLSSLKKIRSSFVLWGTPCLTNAVGSLRRHKRWLFACTFPKWHFDCCKSSNFECFLVAVNENALLPTK